MSKSRPVAARKSAPGESLGSPTRKGKAGAGLAFFIFTLFIRTRGPIPSLRYFFSGMLNRQAQNHSSGCLSGGQPMHSVLMRLSIVSAKCLYSTRPADLQG